MQLFKRIWLHFFPKTVTSEDLLRFARGDYLSWDEYKQRRDMVLTNVLIFLDGYAGLLKELFSLSPAHLELRETGLGELLWELDQLHQTGELARHYHRRLREVENWRQSWLNRPWQNKADDVYQELGSVLEGWKQEDNQLNSQSELSEYDFMKIIEARARLLISYQDAQPFIKEPIHRQNN